MHAPHELGRVGHGGAVAAAGGELVLADLAARTVAAPQDIPVGVLTALTGGPFFLWLMRRRPEGSPL